MPIRRLVLDCCYENDTEYKKVNYGFDNILAKKTSAGQKLNTKRQLYIRQLNIQYKENAFP